MNAMRHVCCYADPVSPYAWLALRALDRIDAAGAHVTVVPVLFAGLLNAHGNLGPAEIEAKRRYLFRDVMREAARRGLPFAGPPGHPFNPLTALRMCTAVDDAAGRRALLATFACAAWERGDNLMDEGTLVRLAEDAGFDGTALLAAAGTVPIKAALAEATARAAADGCSGCRHSVSTATMHCSGERTGSIPCSGACRAMTSTTTYWRRSWHGRRWRSAGAERCPRGGHAGGAWTASLPRRRRCRERKPAHAAPAPARRRTMGGARVAIDGKRGRTVLRPAAAGTG